MNNSTSIYLDLVRFIAALLVFMHHLTDERIIGRRFTQLGSFGEDGVMIFFVLSGYVISYVSVEKESTPRDYFLSRFARLYSVVVPVLALTILFDFIGHQADFRLYAERSNASYPWVRILASLSFTNQFWFFDIRYFSNLPYWSISFEFWYYVLFGVILFLRRCKRWVALGILAVLIGPPILLLAPVWLLGAWVYSFNNRCFVSVRVGWSLFVGSVIVYLVYRYFGVGDRLTAMSDSWIVPMMDPVNLHKARFFMHDYVVGILVAAHLIGAHALARSDKLRLSAMEYPIRFAASYTFSLYLLHYPLLHVLAALAPWPAGDIRRTMMLTGGTIIVTLLIGSVTEKKKHLWKRLFSVLIDFTSGRISHGWTSGSTMLPRCSGPNIPQK